MQQDSPDVPSIRREHLRDYVERRVEPGPLVERVHLVLLSLPSAVIQELLGDPCFSLAMEQFDPGRGSTVWMAAPGQTSIGSRSVVLRRRLAGCAEAFAHYIIAHELAHAYLWNGGWGPIDDREQAADALAASWGFTRPATGFW